MAKPITRYLDVPGSVANGTATSTVGWQDMAVQIAGTFSATMHIQCSVDGTNWEQVGTNITGTEIQQITGSYNWVRIATSVYASGTATGAITGINSLTQ